MTVLSIIAGTELISNVWYMFLMVKCSFQVFRISQVKPELLPTFFKDRSRKMKHHFLLQ